jgi:RimJ/RimL family protein N-acetyltransferase
VSTPNQPIGFPVPNWTAATWPPREALDGVYCRVEPLSADRHALPLFEANRKDAEGRNWTYLPYGPFPALEDYRVWVEQSARDQETLFYAIVDKTVGHATGVASYLRLNPPHGSIEVGHLNFSPLLQGKRAATEAMILMMANAFALGYRRYEWKCDSLNAPSRRAAQRLGFSFEGVFRQDRVVKGRNRDTAWYSIIDQEWPALKEVFARWLDPKNFEENGRQKTSLSKLTAPLLAASG